MNLSIQRNLIIGLFFILNVSKTQPFVATVGCGYTFYARSGSFSSPSYYKPNSSNIGSCQWRISASQDERIVFNVTEIDIPKSPDCTFGYVEVRDGFWQNSPFLGKFCGSGRLDPITSSKNKMLIAYVHNNPNGHRGFFANYEAICGGELYVQSEVNLTYPSDSDKYPLNKKCIWKIFVPEFHQVVLKFSKFDLESHENCLYDYLEIRDGSSVNSTSKGKFCGSQIPYDVISSSNSLLLKFVSDASIQNGGFVATIMTEYDECATKEHECAHECVNTVGKYKCICRSGYKLQPDGRTCELPCGGTLYASSGVLTSPSFPERYPSNETCTWKIIAPEENVIILNFTHFDIEGENVTHFKKEKCNKDKVKIFEHSDNYTKHVGTYCGNILPNGIVSERNKLQIAFITDADTERSGFSLNYRTVVDHCSTHSRCHHKCVTTLTNSSKCVCDDGYLLQENNLDCKKDVCHYEISSKSGFISSPNYPNNYPSNLNCTWRFKTTPGHKLIIEFYDLVGEINNNNNNGGSCYDYVRLYDGDSFYSPNLGEFCAFRNGLKKESTTNEMYLQFHTDHSNEFKGFRAKYFSTCNSNLKATIKEKYFFSHVDYSFTHYQNNIDCEWIIVPTVGYKTILSVEILDIENGDNCEYDYLEIFDGNSSIGKYCGSKKPSEAFTSTNNFKVRFHSDDTYNGKGFRIMYKAVNNLDDAKVAAL